MGIGPIPQFPTEKELLEMYKYFNFFIFKLDNI